MIFNTVPRVSINGINGIYGFTDDGATGKSFLYYVLKDLRQSGDKNVLAITYDINIPNNLIVSLIGDFDKGVIMLDRLDLYISEDIERSIERKASDCIVLFDLKNWNKLHILNPGVCEVFFTDSIIEVELYENSF